MAKLAFQHLDHEPFATILDTFLEERLDFVRRMCIRCLRELELQVHRLKVLLEQLSPLCKVPLQQRLHGINSIPTKFGVGGDMSKIVVSQYEWMGSRFHALRRSSRAGRTRTDRRGP